MDFLPLYKGALNIVVSLGLAAGSTFTPQSLPPQSDLKNPEVVEAYNISPENFNVEPSLTPSSETVAENTEDTQIKLVIAPTPTPAPVQSIEPDVIVGPIQPQTVVRPEPKVIKAEAKEPEVKEEPKTSPSPSATPEPSATPTPSPTATPANVSLSGNSQRMFDMVNEYRAGKGLPAFEKDDRICALTEKRAPQVNGELASGTLHKGFKELNLPYWASENIVAYSTLEQNLKFWLSDYIHKKAIESDAKYSCTSCSGSSCSQIFTSFVAK